MKVCVRCGLVGTAQQVQCISCGGPLSSFNQPLTATREEKAAYGIRQRAAQQSFTLTRLELTKGEGKTYWLTAPEGTELYQTSPDIIDGKLHVWAKVPDRSSGSLTVEFLRAYTGDPLPDKEGITFFGKIPGNHITEVLLMVDWDTRGPNTQEEKQTATNALRGTNWYNLGATGASTGGVIP